MLIQQNSGPVPTSSMLLETDAVADRGRGPQNCHQGSRLKAELRTAMRAWSFWSVVMLAAGPSEAPAHPRVRRSLDRSCLEASLWQAMVLHRFFHAPRSSQTLGFTWTLKTLRRFEPRASKFLRHCRGPLLSRAAQAQNRRRTGAEQAQIRRRSGAKRFFVEEPSVARWKAKRLNCKSPQRCVCRPCLYRFLKGNDRLR